MAKVLTLEEQLAGARGLKARGVEATDAEIAELIASRHNTVAAVGAEMVGEMKRGALEGKLVEAWGRLLKDGGKADRGCVAKLAIVNALCRLDHREPEVYLAGVHHVQKEPSFGPPVDSAGELRGRCAVALAESGYAEALWEAASLLLDEEGQARVGAARAVGAVGSDGAAAVLKLKLLVGDEEPVVLGECCAALLAIAPERSEEFVAGVLVRAGEDEAEAISAVLSENRSAAVLAVLRRWYEGALDERGRMGALRALAVLRVDGAGEYLLGLVEQALHPRAKEVVAALAARRGDERFGARLKAALERRGDRVLERYWREKFERAG